MSSSKIKNIVIPFVIILIVLFPFIFIDKGIIFMKINKVHNLFLDKVFIFLSALGNGLTIALCAIFLLFKHKLRFFYEFAIAFLIQLGVVSLFKQILFADAHRPYKFFTVLNKEHLLNTVEGVKLNLYDSFPSGHTATIFLLVTFFALFYNNRKLSWFLFILAFFVGVSRIYLVQHFYIDVYFGLFFGTTSALLAHYVVENHTYSWYYKRVYFPFFNVKKKTESTMNV